MVIYRLISVLPELKSRGHEYSATANNEKIRASQQVSKPAIPAIQKSLERMHVASRTIFVCGLTPKLTCLKQRVDGVLSSNTTCRKNISFSCNQRVHVQEQFRRKAGKYVPVLCIASADVTVEDSGFANGQLDGFSVATSSANYADKLKISVEVSGTKTQTIFDDVFDKMVAAAQPIPGFRRVKGGKTPGIPKDILLEVLGPSKVFKEVIKTTINSTVAEYVQKEGLRVSKDLQVEQSFEDLESTFEAGQKFSFDVVIRLLDG